MLLEEDDQTLPFAVRSGEDAIFAVMTAKELDIWNYASSLKRFTFTQLLHHAKTTNRKAVSSTLRKAESHQVLRKDGQEYVVELRAKGGTNGTI